MVQLQFISYDEDIQLLEETVLHEEFSYESFKTWATRKLKGYSIAEIDHLAKRAISVDTHEEKIDLLERIRDAIKESQEKLNKLSKEKAEDDAARQKLQYLKDHVSILKTLESKVNAFSIIDHLEEKKNAESDTSNAKHIHIDDNTY